MGINDTLFYTVVLAFISIFFIKKRLNLLVTANTSYWFGWLFLIIGTKISIINNWIQELNPSTHKLILILHFGAFLGFVFASLLAPKRQRDLPNSIIIKANYLSKKLSNKTLLILFLLGGAFFIERLSKVGFNLNYLTDVRTIYLETKETTYVEWLAGHLSVFVGFIVILIGLNDATKKMNIKQLVKVLIASAPLGLANGSRIFLLIYIILYLSSFLLIRGVYYPKNSIINKKELIKIAAFTSILLTIFAGIGFIRGGYGNSFNLFFTIIIWPVSTMMAADSWISVALEGPKTNGMFTLGWIADFTNSINITNYNAEKVLIANIVEDFKLSADPAAVIPKSILPELIFDFGLYGFPIAIFFICFFLQKYSLKYAGKTITYHVISVYLFFGAFMTIQTSLITPQFIATTFWAFIISLFFRLKRI